MYCPLVWRPCGSKVGLVPHLFLRSCKYTVLKYSDANMKINCNLLQGLKGWCRFTEGYEEPLWVWGVMKWKGYIKFKQVSYISERKLEVQQYSTSVHAVLICSFDIWINKQNLQVWQAPILNTVWTEYFNKILDERGQEQSSVSRVSFKAWEMLLSPLIT